MTAPRISVIVPTFERPALLRSCLQSFVAQVDPPEFEVVVVDDGSSDETPSVLAELEPRLAWLRWSSQPVNQGPAAARNRAIAQATGDLLLFIDDDIVASPDLLRRHADLHDAAADDHRAILGRVDWHPSLTVTPFMRWLDGSGLQFAYDTWLREGRLEVPAAAFYTANLSIPRPLVSAVDGFDERFPFPAYEDLELATRLTKNGLTMDYRPAALAYHKRSIDLPTFRRRMSRVGESAQLMRAVAPDFPIDDRALVSRRVTPRRRLLAAVSARLRPDDVTRGAYYWAAVAAAYDEGIQRARSQ
jgi:glycosyltransferase involved in cell wall biosynthesis